MHSSIFFTCINSVFIEKIHLSLKETICSNYYHYHLHFRDDEIGTTEYQSNLPKVTGEANGRADCSSQDSLAPE